MGVASPTHPYTHTPILRLFLAALVFAASGCARRNPLGMAGLPKAGQTRILASRIREDATGVQWEWTIVGDRNWRACRVAGTTFTLSDSYPLNSVSASGGTQVWLLDLSVTRDKSAAGTLARYAVSMRGSTAETASLRGTLPLDGSNVNSVVHVTVDGDRTVSVPAQVTIAHIGRQQIELRVNE